MEDEYDLNRFIDAQNHSYETAFNEIKNGKKETHWMWYIFPQYKGIGRSQMSKIYSIKSVEEAKEYLRNSTLKKRLIDISTAFLEIEGKSANDILGSPDDIKLKSCMTLFNHVQSEIDIFKKVLDKFYEGRSSHNTLRLIRENNKKMPNGGHICCMYCTYNQGVHDGNELHSKCDIFGVKCSPHIICRSFRMPKQSHWSARAEWPMLNDLEPGIVYSVNNTSGPMTGTLAKMYELKKLKG